MPTHAVVTVCQIFYLGALTKGKVPGGRVQVERLQRKFQSIHQTLVHGPSMASGPLSRAIDLDASLMLASTANLSGMAGAVGGPVQTVSPVGTAASAPGTRLVTPVAVTGAKAGAADGSAKATVGTADRFVVAAQHLFIRPTANHAAYPPWSEATDTRRPLRSMFAP